MVSGLLRLVNHFFDSPRKLFSVVDDPRVQSYIAYPLECVFFTGLLMYLCRLGARQLVSSNLRDRSPEIGNLYRLMFGVDQAPVGDTVNDLFCAVSTDQVQSVIHGMVRTLIRKKVLDNYRLQRKWFMIAFDGTQLFSFPERHCKHCLTRTHHGKTSYYHPVLEAKLVSSCGMVFSIMTEFIENPSQYVDKQDCELKSLYRMIPKLKAAFPKTPFCLLLDGLYPNGEIFDLCEKSNWKYIITLKDDQLPLVHEEYRSLLELNTASRLTLETAKTFDTQEFQWIEDIEYKDTNRRLHQVNVLECRETESGKSTRFKFITNIPITKKSVPELSTGGRLRWKIENEGFNVQKNQGFNLEHAYSKHPTGWKVFYLLLQIASTIEQLLRKSNLLTKELIRSAKSSKNLALKLLEALRNFALDVDTYTEIIHQRIQIRFNSS
jgi:hypothetical protein